MGQRPRQSQVDKSGAEEDVRIQNLWLAITSRFDGVVYWDRFQDQASANTSTQEEEWTQLEKNEY